MALSFGCVLPCYNHELFLKQCLDSLFKQSTPFDEIVIVDDSRADTSVKIIDEYTSDLKTTQSFQVIKSKHNSGSVASIEKGVSA